MSVTIDPLLSEEFWRAPQDVSSSILRRMTSLPVDFGS